MSSMNDNIKRMPELIKLGFKRFNDMLYTRTYNTGIHVIVLSVGVTIGDRFSLLVDKQLIGYFNNLDDIKDICMLIYNKTSKTT